MLWFIQVPRLCWFTPIVHSDMMFLSGSANSSASAFRSSAGTPESSEVYSKV